MTSASTSKLRVLVVDDEASIRSLMKTEIPRLGHDVVICESGEAALRIIGEQTFDAALVDLSMPGISGWDVIEHMKKVSPETEVIISTGHGDYEAAIQAVRKGAFDFLPKPCRLIEISTSLRRVAEKRSLTNKTIALESRLKAVEGAPDLVGRTPAMQRVKRTIEKIAPTDSSVLILGETGTGKELVARRIHDLSARRNQPFVAVNCGALPENLVESELFGHRKGAFTGADTPRKGLIEVADGGTLFLDELGELDKSMQVKMLRFLESGEVRRVGENEAFHVSVRIVCATNRDLETMVREGSFREDLFFRVNTFEVQLPPLRERQDDIVELALTLVARHLKRREAPAGILSPETVELLRNYEWTGNVREMANALEHAVILSDGETILPEHLPTSITRAHGPQFPVDKVALPTSARTLREIEMDVIYQVLDKHNGDKVKVAAELGIALKTLYNKLNGDHSRAAG